MKREPKEVLKIVTQENVRDLLVPVPEKAHPSIFPAKEIKRMKSAGNEFSQKVRLAKAHEYEINKKRLEEECERRKLLMKEIDRLKAEKGKNMREIPESQNIRGKILDRAFVAQHEQVGSVSCYISSNLGKPIFFRLKKFRERIA